MFERDDPSITHTGNWYKNGASPDSGGSAALINALDAAVAIAFTGTGISWIGVEIHGLASPESISPEH